MKLILTQEVAGLGGPGDIVEVKDGYGRNYLLPRGAGIRWTRGGEKQITSIRRGREVRAVLIDSTVFSAPRVQRMATPRGTR